MKTHTQRWNTHKDGEREKHKDEHTCHIQATPLPSPSNAQHTHTHKHHAWRTHPHPQNNAPHLLQSTTGTQDTNLINSGAVSLRFLCPGQAGTVIATDWTLAQQQGYSNRRLIRSQQPEYIPRQDQPTWTSVQVPEQRGCCTLRPCIRRQTATDWTLAQLQGYSNRRLIRSQQPEYIPRQDQHTWTSVQLPEQRGCCTLRPCIRRQTATDTKSHCAHILALDYKEQLESS